MCEYCHAYPHLHGCPNEPETEREIVGYCGYCDKPIYEGQWKYELGAETYHYGCALNGLDAHDVLEAIGITPKKAQKEKEDNNGFN